MNLERFKLLCFIVLWGLGGTPSIAQAGPPEATSLQSTQCRGISERVERRNCYRSLRHNLKGKPRLLKPLQAEAPSTILPDAPTTTGAVEHSESSVGRPLCAEEDALKAMLIAEILASKPEETSTNGCQLVPANSQLEVIERYPSRFDFLRIVKVRVTSPNLVNPMVGYTVDIGR
jgi:hypothetical protein